MCDRYAAAYEEVGQKGAHQYQLQRGFRIAEYCDNVRWTAPSPPYRGEKKSASAPWSLQRALFKTRRRSIAGQHDLAAVRESTLSAAC